MWICVHAVTGNCAGVCGNHKPVGNKNNKWCSSPFTLVRHFIKIKEMEIAKRYNDAAFFMEEMASNLTMIQTCYDDYDKIVHASIAYRNSLIVEGLISCKLKYIRDVLIPIINSSKKIKEIRKEAREAIKPYKTPGILKEVEIFVASLNQKQ